MRRIKTLNTAEAIEFINGVVEQCFRKSEDGEVDYIPYLRDTAIRLFTIQMYGEQSYSEGEDIMLFAYGDTFDDAMQVANQQQRDALICAIDNKIEWIKAKLLAQNDRIIAEGVLAIAGKETPFAGVDKALTEFVEGIGAKFESVDWLELADGVKNAKLDPAEFARALVEKKYPVESESDV
ncbi:MAG: hypothetical protein ACI4WS_14945 [Oscillospiraceae bacterium]